MTEARNSVIDVEVLDSTHPPVRNSVTDIEVLRSGPVRVRNSTIAIEVLRESAVVPINYRTFKRPTHFAADEEDNDVVRRKYTFLSSVPTTASLPPPRRMKWDLFEDVEERRFTLLRYFPRRYLRPYLQLNI